MTERESICRRERSRDGSPGIQTAKQLVAPRGRPCKELLAGIDHAVLRALVPDRVDDLGVMALVTQYRRRTVDQNFFTPPWQSAPA